MILSSEPYNRFMTIRKAFVITFSFEDKDNISLQISRMIRVRLRMDLKYQRPIMAIKVISNAAMK